MGSLKSACLPEEDIIRPTHAFSNRDKALYGNVFCRDALKEQFGNVNASVWQKIGFCNAETACSKQNMCFSEQGFQKKTLQNDIVAHF